MMAVVELTVHIILRLGAKGVKLVSGAQAHLPAWLVTQSAMISMTIAIEGGQT